MKLRKFSVQNTYLIALQPVKQCDTNNSGFDPGVMRQRGERERLHLNVNDACFVNALQVFHLVSLREVAECAVQTTLT